MFFLHNSWSSIDLVPQLKESIVAAYSRFFFKNFFGRYHLDLRFSLNCQKQLLFVRHFIGLKCMIDFDAFKIDARIIEVSRLRSFPQLLCVDLRKSNVVWHVLARQATCLVESSLSSADEARSSSTGSSVSVVLLSHDCGSRMFRSWLEVAGSRHQLVIERTGCCQVQLLYKLGASVHRLLLVLFCLMLDAHDLTNSQSRQLLQLMFYLTADKWAGIAVSI